MVGGEVDALVEHPHSRQAVALSLAQPRLGAGAEAKVGRGVNPRPGGPQVTR